MKKIFAGMLLLGLLISAWAGFNPSLISNIVDEQGIAYSKNYDFDLNNAQVSNLSMQIVYSTNSYSAVNFSTGKISTGTITVSSNAGIASTRITIGNVALTSDSDWLWGAKSSNTALNIYNAIIANAYLSPVITASLETAATVIYASSTAVGSAYNYAMTSSTATAIVVKNMTNGTNSSIDYALDTITSATDNKLTLALPVLYNLVSGTTPTGLTNETTYYAIPVSNVVFKLATTQANAKLGTSVDITTATVVANSSLRVTPPAYSGNTGLSWSLSNDGSNWTVILPSTTVTTYTGTSVSVLRDFGAINYKWLRFIYTAGSFGGMKLKVIGNGK
jgi:hypothetical protein